MQVESFFEIIKLDPNVIYESDDDEDWLIDEVYQDERTMTVEWENQDAARVFVVDDENKTIAYGAEEENKPMVNGIDDLADKEPCAQTDSAIDNKDTIQKPRKKLNLAEYKLVRASRPAPKVETDEKNVVLELCEIIPESLPLLELPTDPRSIKALLHTTELQLQLKHEVKEEEVAHMKEEEGGSLPMEIEQDEFATCPDDFEEIVLISMECNTDISIPPGDDDNDDSESNGSLNPLAHIVNTIQKDSNAKSLLDSSTTLFSSINAVVHEKCNASSTTSGTTVEHKIMLHGENKVIMHLRKDRIRADRECIATQTDNSPLFPSLLLAPDIIYHRIMKGKSYRQRSRSRSPTRSRSRSFTPDFSRHSTYNRYPRSLHSSTVNSEFDSSNESDSSAYSSARSSDVDSNRRFSYRSKPGFNNNKNQRPLSKVQEERRIVYIGGLNKDTAKDELRRKFLKYGTIVKISLHEKQDNEGVMRFGFVTFKEATAAFDVLDRYKSDPHLCTFDLRFGGRRHFCKQTYADLDSLPKEDDYDDYNNNQEYNTKLQSSKAKQPQLSFEELLERAKKNALINKHN